MPTKSKSKPKADRPTLSIIGRDGNAFGILASAQRAGRDAGWPKEKIDAIMKEAMSGNYDELLSTMTKYFDVQ